MKMLDVYGIGNPLIDLLAHVPDEFILDRNMDKDRMYLVTAEDQQKLLSDLAEENLGVAMAPGGSCANTIIGIGQLGGKAAFSGKIGADEHGKVYREKLEESGIQAYLGKDNGVTGSSLVLVTDDGSRTMNTYLGMSQELHYEDISEHAMIMSKYVYLTGYLWDTETQREAVTVALEKAKKHQTKITMSLSDPFCVNRHRDSFKELLKNYVDIVFCNQEEAFAMTNTKYSEEALEQLAADVETVVLTLGSRGALITNNGRTLYIDPVSVKAIDTTGAGDAFAAGFLYGITQGNSFLESGRIASFLAAEVISHMGPRAHGNVRQRLQTAFIG